LPENVTISHRGARYEIGRAEHFYGIWPAGSSEPRPLEWWPDTPEGWSGAWARFTSLETPGTIVPVGQVGNADHAGNAGQVGLAGRVGQVGQLGQIAGLARGASPGVILSAALLIVGVVCGIAGLFPSYVGGSSLASEPANLVPHLIYLAVWAASAALILLGGTRMRAGAMFGLGTSVVTFGLFFADAGQVMADGTHVMGAGLVLGLLGWLACAAGSVLAFLLWPEGKPGKPRGDEFGPVVMLMLAALGAAVAFAPSWDSYVLKTAAGASQTITAGNAFANADPVIIGDVLVMLALVAVVALAALWRPIRLGAALLAGAIVPMVAQAISGFVQVGEATSPTLFGITPAQASAAGLTISNGLTPVFWIFCAFVVAMIASCAWMLMTPHAAAMPAPPRQPQAPAASPWAAPGPPTADASAVTAPAVTAPALRGTEVDSGPAPAPTSGPGSAPAGPEPGPGA
jgi:hypothetical protein